MKLFGDEFLVDVFLMNESRKSESQNVQGMWPDTLSIARHQRPKPPSDSQP